MADSYDWRSDRSDVARELQKLIALWDMHATRTWTVPPSRHGVNVGMINAYVSHSVNLARGVLALYEKRLSFESVSLVRSTMEATVTAAWLALYPEKTPSLVINSAQERKKVLEDVVANGLASDGSPGLEQIEDAIASHDGPIDPEGKWLKNRFKSLKGGAELYAMYRVLCTWDHATNSLADAYTIKVEQSETNPWGIVLLNHADDDLATNWIGIELSLVLRAQIAADMILDKPRHKTQLAKVAKRMQLSDTIEKSEPQS